MHTIIPSARVSRVLGAAALAILTTACGVTSFSTRYAPFHPGNAEDVEFRIQAEDGDGIQRARLYVYEYELSLVNGVQTGTQRPGGTWGLVRTWNPAGSPNSIDVTHTVPGFPAASFIRYIAEVTDGDNRTRSEEWYFAAGDWPFGNNPIPIWANGAPGERIDVAFIADSTDYANGAAMLADLEGLVFDGYHINNAVRLGKQYWQFYYSPQTGFISDYDAGPPYIMTIPAAISGSTIIDHAAVIHTTVKRDWASGGNFGTEPVNIGTAAHESGHAAFGLSDEYAAGGHSTSADPHHNNYDSLASCQAYNTANGWPAGDCEAAVAGSWWRPEPSALACIMWNDADAAMPDFERTCINRAIWFYGELTP